jgi:hypothetical protein
MSAANPSSEAASNDALSASVQVLPLSQGLYFISVRSASPASVAEAGSISLPAVYIGPAPGPTSADIELMPGPNTLGNWLCEHGDSLLVKVPGDFANMIIISLRTAGSESLAIDVERLYNRGGEEDSRQFVLQSKVSAGSFGRQAADEKVAPGALRLQVMAHIRNRGDVSFADRNWAGRLGRGLWIEAFSITPLDGITAAEIEYKGVTASGIESPWITNGASCGTRGLGLPLVGFACRLKAQAAARYDCEYSGYFQSGTIVGPLRDGQPCRSTTPNEPLEGMRIQVLARSEAASQAAPAPSAKRASARTRLTERQRSEPPKAKKQKPPDRKS